MKRQLQIFLDIETSGGSQHRVIELAMITRIVGPRGGIEERQEYEQLFNISPDEVHWWATKNLHGIRDSHLAYQARFIDHLPVISLMLIPASVVIAHNVTSDRRFLENEYRLHNETPPQINWLCTRELADRTSGVPYPSNLQALCAHFKVEDHGQGHRALPDARRCEAIFDHLMQVRACAN